MHFHEGLVFFPLLGFSEFTDYQVSKYYYPLLANVFAGRGGQEMMASPC